MTRDSDLSPSIPPSVQAASITLRRWGLGKFWTEFVLGIISCVPVGASVLTSRNRTGGVGSFWAVGGLFVLLLSIYFAWRYFSLGKSLKIKDSSERPKRVEIQQLIKQGLIINLVGMFLSLIGTQSSVGDALIKSFSQTGSNVVQGGCILNSANIFDIQANTAIFTVHFIGIAISLWLLNRLTK
ncbi:hypothetical protein C7H19_05385 [Aphanothece hegewaldii CCALA 016]|uniref:DUF3611 domain-containing protein n=1 Tax=Aphanothece hegewaldii CCALA 016 TaxID=2107694 RepID=A0A2T1M1E0_9CHRO|nr:DUF3611 family protein [Aphanothece hegewaldii]PSF38419.1 hypothetical protein C7H19_05385 [Aphanothece hegewaldii CCALA 016]